VRPRSLDHVAFWVADREPIVRRCEDLFGMHVIDRRDGFTLVGGDARHGKLTFFDAEGPRERGLFRHVGLRVSDLARVRERLPEAPGPIDLGEGILVDLVEVGTEVEFDLDHVALAAADPAAAARAYERYGFERADGDTRVRVGDAHVEFVEGAADVVERPLLNHLAVLVDSAAEHRREAEQAGIEVESVVDAANTLAVFLWAPDRVRVEYVEHKPSFSLR
jgi:catechol 2,3-dioxygenase-like lactoylglutathione lyase family enzyme